RDVFGGAHRITVEIADTGALRTRGLMWRTELPEGTGMLFIFPSEVVQSFWMRNTLIPLDMLFIDKRGRVVGVVQAAEPPPHLADGGKALPLRARGSGRLDHAQRRPGRINGGARGWSQAETGSALSLVRCRRPRGRRSTPSGCC